MPIIETFYNEKIAEQTLNALNECISITDMQDNILFVNNSFLNTYGYTKEELIGKHITVVRANNDSFLSTEILPKTLNGAWEGKVLNRKKDGTEFWVHLRTGIVKDENGNLVALVGSATDLTEQIKAEAKLKEVQDKYRQLFNEIKDVVYESSPKGKLLDINNSGLELFGYESKQELLEIDVVNDLYVNANDREKFKTIIESFGYVKNFELTIKRKNGEHLVVLETALANKDKDGNVISYRGILRDITETKRAEGQLKNYVKELAKVNKQLLENEEELKNINKAKDRLFSIIAHDLRSPFTGLIGFSDYLVEDIDDLTKVEIKTYAKKINEASKNIYNLLENLLEWSRIERGSIIPEFEEFDVNAVIESAIYILRANASNKEINIINNINKALYVYADQNMISSVIRNILSNAIKFTYQGKSIFINGIKKEKEIEIIIKDEGKGMEEKTRAMLFNPMMHVTELGTQNEKGSGLGLIICKELVEKNGGKIECESELGKGSSFKVVLQRAKTI
ncbi:MAG TPA: PAS domain-containing sensor histidine kinase [Melioribacteraceae bacterium]|nr:PAS domain-containing sensor histidine kinase [Melioribacteraceae bacterium]